MTSARGYLALLAASVPLTWLQAAEAESADYVRRDFLVNAAVVSSVPGEGIDGYDQHGSGMLTARARLGLGVRINGVAATARITPRFEEARFLVTVDLEPEDAKQSFGFEKHTLDLTDLKPTAIRLATIDNGRVYQLNLTPGMRVTDYTPRSFNVSKLRLHSWRFPDSPILVNDAFYVGRLGCAQSPVAFIDISGVARVEFSLYQLTDAKPWGVLDRGVVTLTHPDHQTKIQISNVLNGGPHAFELPGGPYRVWVRWLEPTHTVEEHWIELAALRKRILDGELPGASTDYIDKQLAQDPSPWVHSSGLRGLRPGERIDKAD